MSHHVEKQTQPYLQLLGISYTMKIYCSFLSDFLCLIILTICQHSFVFYICLLPHDTFLALECLLIGILYSIYSMD